MATGRLGRNLRLDKHWSYGAYGGVNSAHGPRTFAVNAPVQTDQTKEATIEVVRVIKGVGGEYASNLSALQPAALNAAAANVVKPGEVAWVIVGVPKVFEAGIRELELGEVRRISVE
jgi:zinc protease